MAAKEKAQALQKESNLTSSRLPIIRCGQMYVNTLHLASSAEDHDIANKVARFFHEPGSQQWPVKTQIRFRPDELLKMQTMHQACSKASASLPCPVTSGTEGSASLDAAGGEAACNTPEPEACWKAPPPPQSASSHEVVFACSPESPGLCSVSPSERNSAAPLVAADPFASSSDQEFTYWD
jgi:hypothetical protein